MTFLTFFQGQSRSLDISTDSQIFKAACTSWPGYQEAVMELAVTHVRKYVALHLVIHMH
jgi:hypothetical protein